MSENLVKVTIDDVELDVPAGTLVIRAAEQAGIRIPRFCDHPLLEPVAACRQCLVEVGMPDRNTGELRFMPKPQPSCAQTVTPGMVVKTQHTSEVARRAQEGVMEFLLINHPLDCPICDKGGECPLQNQAMSEGRESSRFIDAKRTYRKPLKLTSQILLDRERCILCQRCVRFGKEIAGDPFLDLQGRGGGTAPTEHHHFMGEQVGSFDTAVLDYFNPQEKDNVKAGISGPYGQEGIIGSLNEGDLAPNDRDVSGRAFASYFSGNIIQICPVGALTSNDYRFRARPFDLVSTASVTEHDASGSAIRVDIRRGEVLRRLAGNDPEVNEEWITDKDRFAFKWSGVQRLNTPFVRENGQLVPTSWSDALDRVHRALAGLSGDQVGFLPGGRLSFEDAWAWSKFARSVVGSDSIDMRSRSHSEEERSFLAAHVAGSGLGVTYSQLENAGQVLLVGLEPEDECGAIFLRMRKATRKGKLRVASLAPMTSRGLAKLSGELLRCAPGTEVEVAAEIREGGEFADLASRLDGGVILVGERASRTPGLLSEVVRLAERTHCRIQWVPRRAGERGGVEAGLLPGLLPFGRPLASQEARESLAWGEIPAQRGLDATQMLEAAADGRVKALVVGGVDLRDFDDPSAARKALDQVDFLVSLEVRRSEVTDRADVILPVAPPLEKNGTFINWEGRLRPFGQAIASRSQTDRLVFDALASEFGVDLGLHDLVGLYDQVNPLMQWNGQREEFVPATASELVEVGQGEALLATHKPMLDAGRLQDCASMLAGSARRPVVFASRATVAGLGIDEGEELTLSTQRGSITLPLQFADLPDGVVWVPECSQGSIVHESLGNFGSSVTLSAKGEVAR
ncbi:MAG: NADH-quinone oxidoreductase subunit G [Actinomyces sp. oral taxon 181]|uniref:NADH-quinone oxidoreductase subunit G n=1 Tax=Actinomyces sp. oral taxon 181 TaxID=712121 RepID=UPI0025C328B1|nr:NADH-quinone oxidoreductase subunit G [Actinomyces sp. oral taxon 181]MBS4795687.1 NADH-quinone oxidoreductase subunit G [Actinomyces sp. oral taxon 181]